VNNQINNDRLENLPITALREPKILLRHVNRDSVDYLEMCDSIREQGILQPILVRPVGDNAGSYEVVEGNYRFTCAREVGLETMPCLIREMDDDRVLVLQLQANAVSPETQPAEYAQRLKKILAQNPGMTHRQLACLIRKSPAWISNLLELTKLEKRFQVMVDRGEIPLGNAYRLAKIPNFLQKEFVEKAQLMPEKEFKALAAACIKQFTEAVKQGTMEAYYAAQFKPQAHLRNLKEIEGELTNREVGALICTAEPCASALDGFYAGLRWCAHLDRESVAEQEETIRQRAKKEVEDVQVVTS
jgi:ParB/RepB/Spo0J family partition protein